MRLAHAQSAAWKRPPSVRGGTIEFKILLEGREGSASNYVLLLANTDPTFKSPRHHHNFDQVRLALAGSTNIGPKRNLEEGDLGYFPEGTYYGPQNQEEVGQGSLSMVVQFGGPEGNGYMSQRQLREGFDQLASQGVFEAGVFRRHAPAADGRLNQDAYEAVWEHRNGRPIAYAKPRFLDAVHVRERNFAWQAHAAAAGVATKSIATFTERDVGIAFVRLDAGAAFALPASDRTQIVFVKTGSGVLDAGEAWFEHSAIELTAGESAALRAGAPTEALILQLPKL
jgi:quercetin dioxygenase-like cupin family protein